MVIGIIYLIYKYKWTVHRTLEYINSKKLDIEITKSIIKQLTVLEGHIDKELKRNGIVLRNDWVIDPIIH